MRAPALVILAAGASARLGRCKALVPLTPLTPLELLTTAGACFTDRAGTPPLVITGADHDEIAAAAPGGTEVLRNPDWERGRSGGVLLAWGARPGRDLCIAPVDVPLVPARVFEALLAAWTAAGSPPRGWLAPSFSRPGDPRSGFGHPILLGRELRPDLASAGPETALRDLRTCANPVFSVAVGSPEILDDLDSPDDFRRLRVR
jgi:CTP:molybdopterin cytidylyltransferase MocA